MCWPNLITSGDMFGADRKPAALQELMRCGRLGAVLALDDAQRIRLRELLSSIEPAFPGTDGNHPVPYLPPRWRLADVVELIERQAPDLIPPNLREAPQRKGKKKGISTG